MQKIFILLIEDNEDIATLLKYGLLRHGIEVAVAATGTAGLEYLGSHKSPDLILLDMTLPDINGLDLLPKVKKITSIPIVILSARSSLNDKISGIEAGGDDYISKPFHIEEVAVRIKAQIRRHFADRNSLRIKDWTLDREKMQAFNPEGLSANLTPNEYLLIETLASRSNKVVTREQLLASCRDNYTDISERAIDTQLSRIRRKLQLNKDNRHTFQAIRGIGYIYNDTETATQDHE